MTDLVLFGDPPRPPDVKVSIRGTKRPDYTGKAKARLAGGIHPATRRRFLDPDPSHKCGNCSHLARGRYHNKPLMKCDHHYLGATHSEASDMRAGWPGCEMWTDASVDHGEEGP